jgi:hypothetical protein
LGDAGSAWETLRGHPQGRDLAVGAEIKVFCFFSSEKKNFL